MTRCCAATSIGKARDPAVDGEPIGAADIVIQHVADDRAELAPRYCVGIIHAFRRIIDHANLQRGSRFVTIGVDHRGLKETIEFLCKGIVPQRVAETDLSRRKIDTGDRQRADRRTEGLANCRDFNAVDQDRRKPVLRREHDSAARRFAVAGRIRTFRFKRIFAGGKTSFRDCGNGIRNTDWIVRRFNDNFRFFVQATRNDFFFRLLILWQFGVGKKITQIESGLDFPGVGGKVATGAWRQTGGRFGFIAHKQGRDVGRRDRRAFDHDLGNDNRPVGNHDAAAVRQNNHEVAPVELQALDRLTGRQDDGIVSSGGDDLGRTLGRGLQRSWAPVHIGRHVAFAVVALETVQFFTHLTPHSRRGKAKMASPTPKPLQWRPFPRTDRFGCGVRSGKIFGYKGINPLSRPCAHRVF